MMTSGINGTASLLKTLRNLLSWKIVALFVTLGCFLSLLLIYSVPSSLGALGSFKSGIFQLFNLPSSMTSDFPTVINGTVHISYNPRPETNNTQIGRPLMISEHQLKSIAFPLKDFIKVNHENAKDFVFVTAATTEYFKIAYDAVARIQKHMPNYTIYFYDISNSNDSSITNEIMSFCNVKYRRFNFSNYPEHLSYGKNYAFKSIVVHEVLREHTGVFWVDSSVRLTTSNFTGVYQRVTDNGGILMFEGTQHSIFAATHETMYKYLPITKEAAVLDYMRGAYAVLLYRSLEIYENILKWWLLCGLVKDCIAPTNSLSCNFKGRDHYANNDPYP